MYILAENERHSYVIIDYLSKINASNTNSFPQSFFFIAMQTLKWRSSRNFHLEILWTKIFTSFLKFNRHQFFVLFLMRKLRKEERAFNCWHILDDTKNTWRLAPKIVNSIKNFLIVPYVFYMTLTLSIFCLPMRIIFSGLSR